jgi:hypothetical protein
MKARDEYLLHMKSHSFYEMFIAEVKKARPPIPEHDHDADNTEKWKSLSAQRRGFDLCCIIFGIKLE